MSEKGVFLLTLTLPLTLFFRVLRPAFHATKEVHESFDGKADMVQSLSNAMMRHLKVFSACCLTVICHRSTRQSVVWGCTRYLSGKAFYHISLPVRAFVLWFGLSTVTSDLMTGTDAKQE